MNKFIRILFTTLFLLALSTTISAQQFVDLSVFVTDEEINQEYVARSQQMIKVLREVENIIDKDTVCKDIDYLREIDLKFDLDRLASCYLNTFLDSEDNAIYKAKDLRLFRENENSEWVLNVSKKQLSADTSNINNTYEKVKEYIASKKWMVYMLNHDSRFHKRVMDIQSFIARNKSRGDIRVITEPGKYYFPISKVNGNYVVNGTCWARQYTKQVSNPDISYYTRSTYDLKMTAKVVNGKVIDHWLDGTITYWGLDQKYNFNQSFLQNGARAAKAKIIKTKIVPIKHLKNYDKYMIFASGPKCTIANVAEHAMSGTSSSASIIDTIREYIYGDDGALLRADKCVERVKF